MKTGAFPSEERPGFLASRSMHTHSVILPDSTEYSPQALLRLVPFCIIYSLPFAGIPYSNCCPHSGQSFHSGETALLHLGQFAGSNLCPHIEQLLASLSTELLHLGHWILGFCCEATIRYAIRPKKLGIKAAASAQTLFKPRRSASLHTKIPINKGIKSTKHKKSTRKKPTVPAIVIPAGNQPSKISSIRQKYTMRFNTLTPPNKVVARARE